MNLYLSKKFDQKIEDVAAKNILAMRQTKR